MNVDVARVLARHDIPDWRGTKSNDLIPLVHFVKAFEAGVRATGDEGFGIEVLRHTDLGGFSSFGRAVQSGATVYDAIMISCRLISEQARTLRFWVSRGKHGIFLCRKQHLSSDELVPGLRQLERYTLKLLVNIVRTGAGPDWAPPKVALSFPRDASFENWSTFANSEAYFGIPFTGIFVPNAVLTLPVSGGWQGAPTESGVDVWQSGARRSDELLIQDLRELTVSLCRQGAADLANVSELTRLSQRTLQRLLKKEGYSFSQLRDQARFRIAVEHLDKEDARIVEVSQAVGYEHPQHFIRAFRRWSGVTPQKYRRLAARTS